MTNGIGRGVLPAFNSWFNDCFKEPDMNLDHSTIAREVEERFGAFLREKINPSAVVRDQTYSTFDVETLHEMGKLGLIGFTADKSIGGEGRTWEEWGHALEEIGYLADDSGLPMLLSYRETANNLVHHSGLQGLPHLIERYAKPAVRGDAFIGWLFTEEKDAFNFETKVTRHGDRYVLNGHKTASTGGMSCTSWIVYAATEDGSDTMAFMVERDDPGVVVAPLRSLGLRSLGLANITFQDVELAKDRIVAPLDGLSHAHIFINERRITGAAWLLGRMRSLIEKVIEDTKPKIRLNRKLSEFDTFKAGIGRMYIALERARSMAYRVFERTEAGRETKAYLHDSLVSVGKYLSTQAAIEVADIAQNLTGGHGYFEPYGIDRYLRDFHGLVPIVGSQVAIESEIGARFIWQHERRLLNK
jgi:alkylation response protein AidB-like acyl-CoA dehydrogenase